MLLFACSPITTNGNVKTSEMMWQMTCSLPVAHSCGLRRELKQVHDAQLTCWANPCAELQLRYTRRIYGVACNWDSRTSRLGKGSKILESWKGKQNPGLCCVCQTPTLRSNSAKVPFSLPLPLPLPVPPLLLFVTFASSSFSFVQNIRRSARDREGIIKNSEISKQ